MSFAPDITLHVTLTAGERQSLSIPAKPGDTVAAALWQSGRLRPAALCSGLGRCGACRVRFACPPPPSPGEEDILGREALDDGWRLGCRHAAADGMRIEVPAPPADDAETGLFFRAEPEGRADDGPFVLAVDLGTTSVCWRLTSRSSGRCMVEGRLLNPQMGAGSDVMSRIAAARTPEGRSRLREPVLRLLRRLVQIMAPVSELCVAGNTAMTAILLDKDCAGLAAAPYSLPEKGGRAVALPGLPPVWIPPQIAPFVGGDITSGVLALKRAKIAYPFLLADMGTNGEFVLALDEARAVTGSVPLGPALEGIGMRHGVMAGPGSVTAFTLGPSGITPHFWRNEPPAGNAAGIAGAGYLSLIALLLRLGVIGPDGRPAARPSTGIASRLLDSLRQRGGGWSLPLGKGLALEAADVEEVLKVRAAFALTAQRLLREKGLSPADPCWVLSGALGGHVSGETLATLGFLPSGTGIRLSFAGNTSLDGAERWLLEPADRADLARWAGNCGVLDLRSDADFTAAFVGAMRFDGWQAEGYGQGRA